MRSGQGVPNSDLDGSGRTMSRVSFSTRMERGLLRIAGSVEYGKSRVSIPGEGARDCEHEAAEADEKNGSSCL